MNVKITKLTGVDLLRKANSFTSGKESKQSLKSAYRCGHTTIRTQIFFVECYGIPQYVAYHLRTHFSLYAMAPQEYGWMKSKRTDKGGLDFVDECRRLDDRLNEVLACVDNGIMPNREDIIDIQREVLNLTDKYDRMAPTDFGFLISAEGLMTMAEKRLCIGAVSKETREVVEAICQLVEECDPDLYPHLRKPCVLYQRCREAKCCGYIHTEQYRNEVEEYNSLFPNSNLQEIKSRARAIHTDKFREERENYKKIFEK